MNRLFALVRARLLEVVRDRSALAWNLLFAPLLVIGMAAVLSGGQKPLFTVAVLGTSPMTVQTHPFFGAESVAFHHEPDQQLGIASLQHHRIDLLIDADSQPLHYWVNPQSDKGLLLQRLLLAQDPNASRQTASGEPLRYSDWLVPGLLGVNIMFSSLFAVGHIIVRYRKSGYLKRLNATPLTAMEFISAQLLACLAVVVVVACLIFTACRILLHLRMQGSYLDLLLVTVLGSMAMITMSLLVAARISSEEVSGGLLNLLSWPMVVLSGVFFSLDGAPKLVQSVAQVFPLTPMLSAARAVMVDGAGLSQIAPSLLSMAAMTVVFLAVGSSLFRWTQD